MSSIDAATQLRLTRILLNWRQQDMADVLMVSREAVCAWETASRKMPRMAIGMMMAIAKANGVVFDSEGYPRYAHGQGFEPTP